MALHVNDEDHQVWLKVLRKIVKEPLPLLLFLNQTTNPKYAQYAILHQGR